MSVIFFFSSRRRHTRYWRDWSSDVCSSDLAITWLGAPVRSRSFKPHNGGSIFLGDDTWSPINTQNTGLHRDLTVTYYFVRMGYPLAGLPIDRYGDIFSGYLSQACVKHMGEDRKSVVSGKSEE